MAWLLVVLAGLFEIGMAATLKASDGFTRLPASIAFGVCSLVSFSLLATALRHLPVGTAYAVWTGIGAAARRCWASPCWARRPAPSASARSC